MGAGYLMLAHSNDNYYHLQQSEAIWCVQSMYVCLCKGITDRALREAASRGISDIRQACRELGVGSECGQCKQQVREVLCSSGKNSISLIHAA